MFSVFIFFLGFILKIISDLKTPKVNNPMLRCLVICSVFVLFSIFYGLETKSVDNTLSWLTAFFLELVLSFDNLAVIMLIMLSAKLGDSESKLVLNYGILGAIVMRCILLCFGVGLATKFSYVLFPIFGFYLAKIGIKMLKGEEGSEEGSDILDKLVDKLTTYISKIPMVAKWIVPITLLPIILRVELTDLLFAVDSIPAVLAISSSMPIVITSNLAAVSFLRELYLVFADLQKKLKYLTVGVSYAILVVAVKLLMHPVLHMTNIELPTLVSFVSVLTPIVISIILSFVNKK